ncbi:methyl-accepting chemotaxis protein [Dechloromonas sp. ZS-1]|uniref:methyl-accepting chemotaxis protein n=1 Tax=Dechloromonas sp. ZS-1 TaxID=3138067 RepID=UPI0031FD6CC4
MLKNFKIGTRLSLLLSSLILLMAAMFFVGQSGMANINAKANSMNNDRWPKVLLLQEGLASVNGIAVAARDLMLAENSEIVQRHKQRILDERAKIGLVLGKLKPSLTDPRGIELFGKILEAREAYIAGQNKLIALAESGRMHEGRGYLDEFLMIGREYRNRLNALIAFQGELMAEAGEAANVEYANARNHMIISALLALLIAIGIGIWITRSITRPLGEAVLIAGELERGNLSVRIEHQGQDETGQLLLSMRSMVSKLAEVIGEVKQTADYVSGSASQLNCSAQELLASTDRQATSTAASAAAVEQLTVSIDHVATGAREANIKVVETGEIASASGVDVDAATLQIQTVAQSVDATSREMDQLSDSIRQIGHVATVIREIAEQTNLLALNAAIEAARAGEQGRGFAVVADEVRKLAERTTGSVQEINSMIGNIEQGTQSAVAAMRQSSDVVAAVVSLSGKSSSSIRDTCVATTQIVQSINDIASALDEQRLASTELATNVEAIAQMSEQNMISVTGVTDASQGLANASEKLRASVSFFRIG